MLGTDVLFDKLDDVSHRALHFAAGVGFFDPIVVFASKAVASQVVVREVLENLRDCQRFVFHNDAPAAAGLRGSGFEYLVHAALSVPERDRTFKVRALGDSPALSSVTLRCSKARFIEATSDIAKLVPGEYGIGRSSFPAVDGVMKRMDGSVDLVQVTVSEDHGIKHHALQNIVESLNAEKIQNVRFLWIVPGALFPTFPSQTFRQRGSTKVHQRPDAALSQIPQYVVAFPEDDGLLKEAAASTLGNENFVL